MPIKSTTLLILTLLFAPATTRAQVFELGPSPSNLFDTVINIPSDVAMTSAGNSTQINLAPGGELLGDFDANAGSEINISGGNVGPHPTRLYANAGSEVNISGGTITNLAANSGSVVNFLGGGHSNSQFWANAGSTFNLFGNFGFRALSIQADSQLNIYGHAFSLGDAPLDGLVAGVPFEITDRSNLILNSLLPDGESFVFNLGTADPAATITITLVPEPSSIVLVISLLVAFHSCASRLRRVSDIV